jgi:hypothetical protein
MHARHDISRPVWIIVPHTASGRKNFALDILAEGCRGFFFGVAFCDLLQQFRQLRDIGRDPRNIPRHTRI